MRRLMSVPWVLAIAMAANACGGGGDGPTAPLPPPPPPSPAPTVISVSVSGPSSLIQGTTAQVTTTCGWNDSATRTCPSGLTWASSVPSVASVTAGGMVTALSPGSSQISASVGGVTGALGLEVRAPSISFIVEGGVSAEAQEGIKEGIELGHAFLRDQLGWELANDVVVTASAASGPPTAYAGSDRVVVNTGSSVWATSPNESRRKIMVHELYHVFQLQTGLPLTPTWLGEGVAEFVAHKVAFVDTELLTPEQIRGCHVWNLFWWAPPVGPLASYKASIGEGPTYSLFYLAFEWWMLEKGGGSLKTYSVPPESFYAEFEAYRKTLVRPERYECFGFRE